MILKKKKAILAKQNAIEYSYAWKKIGLEGTADFDEKILNEARQLANNYKGLMGGPGHINFIYNAIKLLMLNMLLKLA